MEYRDTLIAVADDCKAAVGEVPPPRAKPTVAALQYEMLAAQPYTWTQEDVLFLSWLRRQDPLPTEDEQVLRARMFSTPQACLRASPLPKTYGWGLHFDGQGRVALVGVETAEYRELVDGGASTVLKAMRSSRR